MTDDEIAAALRKCERPARWLGYANVSVARLTASGADVDEVEAWVVAHDGKRVRSPESFQIPRAVFNEL